MEDVLTRYRSGVLAQIDPDGAEAVAHGLREAVGERERLRHLFGLDVPDVFPVASRDDQRVALRRRGLAEERDDVSMGGDGLLLPAALHDLAERAGAHARTLCS